MTNIEMECRVCWFLASGDPYDYEYYKYFHCDFSAAFAAWFV
jgi:hypothetical protein